MSEASVLRRTRRGVWPARCFGLLQAACLSALSACSLHSLSYLDDQSGGAGVPDTSGMLGVGSAPSAGASEMAADAGNSSGGADNAMAGQDSGGAGAAGKTATDGGAGAPPAGNPPLLTNNAKYTLHPGHDTTLCADDRGRNLFNGASVIQYACNGQTGQEFVALDRGEGYFAFKNALNGRCLEVAGASAAANAVVDLSTCTTADDQLWLVSAASGGLLKLVAKHSGMALDVDGAQSTVSDTSLVQNPYDASLDMQWRFDLTH